MSKARVKKSARPSRGKAQSGKTVASTRPKSLPPSGSSQDVTTPSTAIAVPEGASAPAEKKWWTRDKGTLAYERAMQILAMRAAGLEDKEIASSLKITPQSVWNYCYLAGKNEWITDELMNAKDTVEFKILPKAMRVIEEGLDDEHRNEKTGFQVKQQIALKMAELSLGRQFEDGNAAKSVSNVIAIRIEQPPGVPMVIREGTIGGTPAYQDAEVADDVGQQPGLVST